MEVKLYVGNLSFSTTEDELRNLFTQAGALTTVELIKDRETGTSRGFAFVTMGNQPDAAKAITMFNGYQLGDRELKVNTAKAREEGGSFGGPRRNDSYNRGGPGGGPAGRRPQRGGPKRY